jgi:thiol:disulfide interchange protein
MTSSLRGLLLGALLVLGACDAPKAKRPAAPTADQLASTAPGAWTEADPRQPIGPQLVAAANAAAAAGKRPFAYLHAAWCGPCKVIAATHATDPQMQAAFADVIILGLDLDDVPEAELAAHHLLPKGIPTFFRLDASGAPTGDTIDGGAWGDDVPANMAPALTAFFAR